MPINPEMLPDFADFEFTGKKTNRIAMLASCILSSRSSAIAVGFTPYRSGEIISRESNQQRSSFNTAYLVSTL
jgi:hypothetical protein